MKTSRVAVVGAGVGGLVAAIDLARRGLAVTLLERGPEPGGKMRTEKIGAARIDAGPTVFTLRRVFDEIFADAGENFADAVALRPMEVLARHAWNGRDRLDLFADIGRSADAIGQFAGAAEARGYLAFSARARSIYQTLENSFIRNPAPTPLSLVRDAGLSGFAALVQILPFAPMWKALGGYFHDPRLQQLFARYATYNGSSPFLAPATLMLIAHVEQDGVWSVAGGMHQIARALAALAERQGALLRYGAAVAEIFCTGGRAAGVVLQDGERIGADAVVVNGDAAAIAAGCFGPAVAGAVPPVSPAQRSLSAVTWAMLARTSGFSLDRHNVFFSADYAAEFDDIFRNHRLPAAPTVYVCAQDHGEGVEPDGEQRLLCLVNAPASGDGQAFSPAAMARCEQATFGLLESCGLRVERGADKTIRTDPAGFAEKYPATGGALYGRAVHGAMGVFQRPGARTRLPGLYLAGGSTHPGAGVPMAALSGRMAAAALIGDLA